MTKIWLLGAVLAVGVHGCDGPAVATPAPMAGPGRTIPARPLRELTSEPRVCLAVSVDWEGAFLDQKDLTAMARFAREVPEVPLTHLLSAGYFSKSGADPAAIAEAIAAVIGERDETGLHVHAWESLVRAAGVTPRAGPLFLGAEPLEIVGDLGFDVELEAYATEEVEALIETSRTILREAGFSVSQSFRAGGWLAGPRVLAAARRAGFERDTSATDARWLDELARAPLPDMVRARWPDIDHTSQPFWIETGAGPLLEMPDSGALADYVTAEEMVTHVQAAVAASDEGTLRFVQLGFHQEGAADYMPRVVRALQRLVRSHRDAIHFATLEECARRYQR